MAMPGAAPTPAAKPDERPLVSKGVEEYFVPFAGEAVGVKLPPRLVAAGHRALHIHQGQDGRGSRVVRFVNPIEKRRHRLGTATTGVRECP